MNSFLATVSKVFTRSSDFVPIDRTKDYVAPYNDNTNYGEFDATLLGAIKVKTNKSREYPIVFPFDKNNMTYPIEGETVLVIDIGATIGQPLESDDFLGRRGRLFWLPYSKTEYPNYREDYATTRASTNRKQSITPNTGDTAKTYSDTENTGITGTSTTGNNTSDHHKPIYEKIKFLEPNEGDTIIQGRAGNSIRFSQNFNITTPTGEIPSPAIVIRNRQNANLDNQKIGFLGRENINTDGSSIYLTSNKTQVEFNYTTVEKKPVAFKNFPSAETLTGDQIFVNSDRIVLASKAKELIIFGKSNVGVITDGIFSVDSELGMNVHSNGSILIQTANTADVIIDTSAGGNVLIGSNNIGPTYTAASAKVNVQPMVMGASLVQILKQIVDACVQMSFATGAGPTPIGSLNRQQFTDIKSRLENEILSIKSWVSK